MADMLSNPLLQEEDTGLRNRIENRLLKELPETFEEYGQDKINLAEVILRSVGAIGGSISDVVNEPLDRLMNALGINEAIANQVKELAQTEKGKELVKWSSENPRATKNILAALDSASVLPSLQTAKNTLNSAARGSRTMVQGGTVGDVVQKVREKIAEKKGLPAPDKMNYYNTGPVLFVGDMLDGLAGAVQDAVIPSKAAAARQSGILSNARKEIKADVESGRKTRAEQAALAKRMLALQNTGKEPGMLSPGSPLYDYYIKEGNINVAGPRSRLSSPNNVPWNQEGLDRVKANLMEGGLDEQAAERVINDFKMNVFSSKGGSTRDKIFEFLNPSKQGMFTDVWNPSAGGAFRETGGMTPFAQAGSTVINRVYDPKVWGTLPKELQEDLFTLSRMAKVADDDSFRAGRSQMESFKELKKAYEKRLENKELTAREKQVLSLVDNEKTVKPPSAEDPRQYVNGSYVSKLLSALGGTHTVSMLDDAVELKTGAINPRITTTAGDKHDILGADFLFPKQNRSVVISPQRRTLNRETNSTDLRRDSFLNKSEVPVNMEEIQKLEQLSGVPYIPGENPVDYQLRAIGDFKGNPELTDYMNVSGNIGRGLYLGSDWRQQLENEYLNNK
jgi:hypothetical protein